MDLKILKMIIILKMINFLHLKLIIKRN